MFEHYKYYIVVECKGLDYVTKVFTKFGFIPDLVLNRYGDMVRNGNGAIIYFNKEKIAVGWDLKDVHLPYLDTLTKIELNSVLNNDKYMME